MNHDSSEQLKPKNNNLANVKYARNIMRKLRSMTCFNTQRYNGIYEVAGTYDSSDHYQFTGH